MLLDCGVGEDSWESLRLQGDPTSESGEETDDREWDGWMASPTQWTCVWVSSRSWWWTGRPGVLQSMGSQRVGYDWATELNWERMQALPADSTEFRVWVLAFSAGKIRVRRELAPAAPILAAPHCCFVDCLARARRQSNLFSTPQSSSLTYQVVFLRNLLLMLHAWT